MRCLSCSAEYEAGSDICPSCGTPLDELPAGAVMGGKYIIRGKIGSGGMGKVYAAEHQTLGKTVAVKVLHHKYMGKRDLIKRFKTEALASSRISHPKVVQTLDFGEDDSGLLYIVMEHIEGQSLETVIVREWPLGDARILHIAIQILQALEDAHEHGIIHRDLKPENILLEDRQDQVDQVKVLDFGLAKALDAPMGGMSKITAVGSTCGTPEYMSPEQAQGADLDARSDLYSLGVLMFRMVTGRPPFIDPNPVSVAAKHVTETVPRIRAVRADAEVIPELEEAIYKALAKQREQRFESARSMRHHLTGILHGLREGRDVLESLDMTADAIQLPGVAEALDSDETWAGRAAPGILASAAVDIGTSPWSADFASGAAGSAAYDDGWDSLPTDPSMETQGAHEAGHERLHAPVGADAGARRGPGGAESDPWDGVVGEDPATATRPSRRGLPLMAALVLVAIVGVVAFSASRDWFRIAPNSAPLPVLANAGEGVEVRGKVGDWAPQLHPRDLSSGDRIRAAEGAKARVVFHGGAAVDVLSGAEIEVLAAERLELVRGALSASHPGGDAGRLQVRVTAARATARLSSGSFRIAILGPDGIVVANREGQADIDVVAGLIPVRAGSEVIYHAGQEPRSRPLPPPSPGPAPAPAPALSNGGAPLAD